MPAAVMAETVRAASSTDSKMPSSVATVSGLRKNFTVIAVAMPTVPSVPDKKAGHVVAVGLGRLAAELHDLAAGHHHLHSGNVVYGDAMHQGVRAAGILRDIAADGAGLLAGGIGREVQPEMRDMFRELQVDHAGLHHRALVLNVNFQDAVHAREGDHDAALLQNRAAAQSGTSAARHHGNFAAEASRMICETCWVFCGKTTAPGVLLRIPASYSYNIRSSGRSRTASRPAILRR